MDNKFPITLTEYAAKKALEYMAAEGFTPDKKYLRTGVRGGGCAGMTYVLDFVDEVTEFDLELNQFGVRVIIDQISASHLDGTVLDFVDTLNDVGFKFLNPNQTRTCGCNKSFS